MGDKDLLAQQEARDAVEAASFAFQTVAKLSQAKIDEICDSMARVALSEAARLGKMANEETGFGRAEDKKEKNRFAAEDVWNPFHLGRSAVAPAPPPPAPPHRLKLATRQQVRALAAQFPG